MIFVGQATSAVKSGHVLGTAISGTPPFLLGLGLALCSQVIKIFSDTHRSTVAAAKIIKN